MNKYTTAEKKEKLKDKSEELAKEMAKMELSNDFFALTDALNDLRVVLIRRGL